jgi:glycolate oxidase iron-sulfur subunit
METHLADFIRDTSSGREAEAILRSCVHCGFCNATCPTYQLFGDELDGPRGRIYLVKQVLEGRSPTKKTQLHLDRCLTCRACETTCPSGVQYSRLLDIGRAAVAAHVSRRVWDGLQRKLLRAVLPRRRLFSTLLWIVRTLAPVLPRRLRPMPLNTPPVAVPADGAARTPHARRMLLLGGCVQPGLAPGINAAAVRLLDRLRIALIEAPQAGCCGALPFHLDDVAAARDMARRNIDAWWPALEAGAEAIVSTASGCGVQLRDYAHLLQADSEYAAKARRVSELARDIGEVLAAEGTALQGLLDRQPAAAQRIAFHAPCTLQHGLRASGGVDRILRKAGFDLAPVPDAHLCCGSAGTYSLLQPDISRQLRDAKLEALQSGGACTIASANIGCINHLQSASTVPVHHWVELLDAHLAGKAVDGRL